MSVPRKISELSTIYKSLPYHVLSHNWLSIVSCDKNFPSQRIPGSLSISLLISLLHILKKDGTSQCAYAFCVDKDINITKLQMNRKSQNI